VKLSRRDRAAMTLALECVRESRCGLNEASRALGIGDADSRFLREAMGHNWYGHVDRVRRARLALALRVLLRADAGDFARRVVCPECGSRLPDHYKGGERIVCDENDVERSAFRTCRVRPLWESAPEHRSE